MARQNSPTLSPAPWRKSSYSGSESGSCLEVQDHHPTSVPVRDSKIPDGPTLLIPAPGWSAFVTAVRNGALAS
ncbi:DUF397 domain-containing protein [Streptomyces bacillaris]|uniref:DUF397 domain-containing protein n=1 Tax=Streptomyces cavourensis TaxID=67258 RepID=A0AAD0VEB7_9ACTN|nr:DUF397 domain-containing protein [Streptomyces cavourensis]ATY95840.1 DUF397 domain-containing protein [Streptomyces cavourensis]AXI71693.1 DUF397 domain-containing protein [Streptomyces cavourensis]MBH0245812.1 DUF397 domain-containing protein [Streptomyces cavourensis]UTR82074.1 DUF397 domain-containing protein [Streptomyces cavourensis]WAE66229.1 DUF397 domain-containing protein [Streptomyces cavourensis]